MAAWKSQSHLLDHYDRHRGQLRSRSVDAYDASAQQTIEVGVRFTYRDPGTGLSRVGYFHRETSRMTVIDSEGFVASHFLTDEEYVATLELSTYSDE